MLLLLSPCRGAEKRTARHRLLRVEHDGKKKRATRGAERVYRGEAVVDIEGIQIKEEAFCRWTLLIIQGKTVAERTRVPPTGHAKPLSDRFN